VNLLIIGSGGREHALAWAASRSPRKPKIFALPGNPGIAELGSLLPGDAGDHEAIAAIVAGQAIDLVLIGPEAPLVAGLADLLTARGVRVFGPRRAAAALEGSKVFAKELMARAGVPTAGFRVAEDPETALAWAAEMPLPHVLKADGLAGGKGALIIHDRDEARAAVEALMIKRQFGDAGRRVVFEEFLEGEEMSVFALVCGEEYALLPASQDYKRVGEGDRGFNTGGMGAYAPVIGWTPALETRVRRKVIEPTLAALASAGTPYTGLLYCGLMVQEEEPAVVEYNCRFGDPETQAVVPLLAGDLLEALWAASDPQGSRGALAGIEPDGRSAVCVVVASECYPGTVRKRVSIPRATLEGGSEALIFQAGTRRADGGLETAGGRVLNIVGLGEDLPQARANAYGAIAKQPFEGAFWRRDIAWRGMAALERASQSSQR
jgi:phosphoribosylamine--glycine ligase